MKINVERRTNSDRQKFFNGTFKENFDATVTSNGTTITMSLEKTGTGDLTMQFSDGLTLLDTTPAATITLTAGSDTSPQVNYIYIPLSTKVLTKSTSAWPTTEHIKVGFFFVQSAATTQTAGGALINQNWNDPLSDTNIQGHMSHIAENIRLQSATYFDGVDPNGDASTYLVNTVGNTEFKSTSGNVYQLHKHAFPAFDTSAGDTIHVKNWSGDAYHAITNLFDITTDSGGNTIGNNKYFNLTIWGVVNKTGEHQTVLINLPSGFYNTQDGAENDVLGFDDFTMPREFSIDSSVGFLITRITIQMGTTWTHVSAVDLRGTNPQTASGGASGVATTFADNTFAIFDETDNTKILNFDVGTNVSTATTRTLKIPDGNGTLLLSEGLSGGQTLTGDTASGGDLILTSTSHATKGNVIFGNQNGLVYDEENNRLTIGDIDSEFTIGGVTKNASFAVHNQGGANAYEVVFERHSNNVGPFLAGLRTKGSEAAPTAVVDNDVLFEIFGAGWDGTDFNFAAGIKFEVDGDPSDGTDMPGRIVFLTTPDGSGTLVEAMRINSSQDVILSEDLSVKTNKKIYLEGIDTDTYLIFTGTIIEFYVNNTLCGEFLTEA